MSSIPAITWSIICKRRRHFPLLSRFHQAHYFPYPFYQRIHTCKWLETYEFTRCNTVFIYSRPIILPSMIRSFSGFRRKSVQSSLVLSDYWFFRVSLLSLFLFFSFFFFNICAIRAYNHAFPTIYTFSFAILRAPFFSCTT